MADVFRETHLLNLNALIEKTGYNIVQENGQRKYGPPPGWIGPPPPKGSEIFVGKLPRDVFEHELVPLCEQFGKIYELRLMMDFNGENRGYAFVTYTNNEDASKAIKGLDDYEIRPNRHIGVCKSVDNCRLFIGGIPKDKSKEEILNEISKYTDGVSKVILYSCITDKAKNRGFAFVEYESHRAAAMARRKLISNGVKLFDHDIAVDWAQPEAQVEDETMKRVKVLYVRNLSPLTTEDQLHRLFSMGGVLRVERVKKMRDFAFIHYCKREEAESALKQLDGCVFDGCTLEVTWAKPADAQKQRNLVEKRDTIASLYKQMNYDVLDHSFDLNLSPTSSAVPGFPMISRANMKSRLPMQNIPNFKNSFTITRPVQLLNYICLENGWGEPVYNVSCVESDPSELFFVCSVLIPGFPLIHRKFMSDRVCRSPDEAKYYAACYVLKKLSITDIDGSVFPPSVNSPNALNNFSKNFPISNSPISSTKSVNNMTFYTPPKNFQSQSYIKMQDQFSSFMQERGQGDAGFLSNTSNLDTSPLDDIENLTPLLDPNTPIEPNSILGLLASVAAASNVDLPLFNKPKL